MQIRVPPLGESITEATISRWLTREGAAVAAGQMLVELETDKITVEVPALKDGVLVKQLKSEGEVVKVDEVLAELDERARLDPSAPAEPPASIARPAAVLAADVRSAPSARRLADESGVNLADVTGTGRGGVVSKPDVIEYLNTPSAVAPPTPAPVFAAAPPPAPSPPAAAVSAPAPASVPASAPAPAPAPAPSAVRRPPSAVSLGDRETREAMTTRRKRIAENLLQAQHATAHLTTFNEIDMSALSALRERMKEKVENEHGLKLSFMPFFARAVCLSLKAFPAINAQIDGESIVYKHYVNLGIAVASEAGLVVPNVKDADRKGILDISRDIGALARKARDSTLTMDDLTGGSFTITNGGVFGSLLSTPIINYPQAAILGLHKTQDRPVAVSGQVVIRPMMYVALSYDHRLIDGQQAVLFLLKLKDLIEDPASMLID